MAATLIFLLLLLLTTLPDSLAAHSSHQHHHHKDLDSEYSFKSVLYQDQDGTYTLHWKFDQERETITFAVNVSTEGWVGFGLSPNGGMAGSDMVIGWVTGVQAYLHVSHVIIIVSCIPQGFAKSLQ